MVSLTLFLLLFLTTSAPIFPSPIFLFPLTMPSPLPFVACLVVFLLVLLPASSPSLLPLSHVPLMQLLASYRLASTLTMLKPPSLTVFSKQLALSKTLFPFQIVVALLLHLLFVYACHPPPTMKLTSYFLLTVLFHPFFFKWFLTIGKFFGMHV